MMHLFILGRRLRREFQAVGMIALIVSVSFVVSNFNLAGSEPKTITVPDDYLTIGEALAAANSGDTLFVKSGVYAESLLKINKTLHLIGQDRNTTIIEGSAQDVLAIVSVVGVTVEGFTIKNSWAGSVYVGGASCVNISDNIISGSLGRGIQLSQTSNSTLCDNSISNCSIGISIEDCSLIDISRNNISQIKSYSLDFLLSDNVNVYHNNIYDGNAHFVDSQVACDNSYPSGGNFWSRYSGSDNDGDKIGDTPFIPDPNATSIEDRYPLITAFPCIHDLELEGLGTDTPVFNRGRIVNVELGIKNTGHFNEIFNATIYSNSTAIAEATGTIATDDSLIIILSWNTTEFSGGDYFLWAQVEPVSGETYILNNEYSYGVITIFDAQVTEFTPCNQAGDPLFIFNRGSIAYFKVMISVRSAFSPAVFTLNLHDAMTYPIGLCSFKGPLPMGNTTLILGVPIPLWATMGTAKAYANLFTDWPHQGGTPFCFETETQFAIAQETGAEALSQVTDNLSSTHIMLSESGSNVEAGPYIESELSLSISTNKTSYFATQGIGINGQLTFNALPLLARLLAVEIRNPAGDTIVTRTVETQDAGSFNLGFRLPPNTQLGNYTASASFSLLGQSVTAEAVFELVKFTGDLNRDWIVDIFDIVIVALEFGHPPPPIVDMRADVNKDGLVDIFDIVVVALHFGETS